ncbi:MAG: translation initiation factor IF-2 [Bdellovibrionales bacterium]|nr:translation initiation factor IF-2 [Bdellovibrionales bacterium]
MNQMKVFEFAKEIGIETISLMDKIREWKLPIKSHMATLDEELITSIKDRLREEEEALAPKKKGKAKAAPKKAAAKKTAVKKSTTVAKPVRAKTKKAAAKVESEAEGKVEAAPKAKATVTKKVGKGIIRRKAGEIAAQAAADAEAAAAAAAAESAEAQSTETDETVEATSADETSNKVGTKGAVRRNIVGRMDLSKATRPPAAPGGAPRPAAASAGRNIRTGFFATGTPELSRPETDFEEERKKEEKKKKNAAAKEETVQTFNASDFRKREVIFQPKKKKVALRGDSKKTNITVPKASKRVIKVEKAMTVADLAQAMGVKAPILMKKLMTDGVKASMNTPLDFDTIALIAPEFNFEAENVHKSVEQMVDEAAFGDLNAKEITRAPVVTVMGHVDHGKTSLLDAIRKANVVDKEAGGITQHIGAYKVKLDGGKEITFLDTPGHEAFTQMRARGANVTDIAIIVVAADDGVMPQTAEAINHAKAAEVPIIIAVNKMDKPGASADKIKQQLTEFQIVPEEWGGSNIFCEVSALNKTGIPELLEQILLVAEVEDLKANASRSGTGIVIEARLDKGRGPVATLLVQDGTVRVGDDIVVGKVAGRVRAMINDRGENVKEAGPSDPVEIIGLSEPVLASDRFDIVKDESISRAIAEARKIEAEKPIATGKEAVSLEELFAKVQKGSVVELNVVLKADVSGSLEALRGMLEKAATSEVKVKVIHANVGGITETDILLASTSGGIVLGFNVRPDTSAIRVAKERNVDVKTYTIIYELLDDVKKAMGGLLQPTLKEVVNGRAEVREVFGVPKVGNIAGCTVTDGKITRADQCRLLREGVIIYTGKFSSLKRFKDDVREVANGFECGIGIENFNDIKVGDQIEAFVIEKIAREL